MDKNIDFEKFNKAIKLLREVLGEEPFFLAWVARSEINKENGDFNAAIPCGGFGVNTLHIASIVDTMLKKFPDAAAMLLQLKLNEVNSGRASGTIIDMSNFEG